MNNEYDEYDENDENDAIDAGAQGGLATGGDNDWHRTLLDGSLQGFLVVDQDDLIVYANQAICNIHGYDSTDQMLQLPKSSILIAEDDQVRLRRYRTDRLDGRMAPDNYRYRGRRRDGGLVWLTNLCRTITLNGRAVVQNSITDISQQVAAEDALRRSEQRYRDLIESTLLGILIFDGGGRPLLVNQAAAALFGYEQPEQIMDLTTISPLSADAEPSQRLEYQIQRLEGVSLPDIFELRGRRQDGAANWLQGHVQVVEWDGAPAIQVTMIDIGEQKRMRAALHAVDAQLQRSQRLEMVGQLTGGVAHDFNNLLAVIAGNAEMLNDGLPPDAELEDHCRRIVMATKRGAELTHRLLAFSRRQALNPRPTDLNILVNDMGELLRRTLGAAVSVHIESEYGLWDCEIDPTQMENVLLNLAINARDAMPDGGDLTIASHNRSIAEGDGNQAEEIAPGDYVVISVTDNGVGMADKTLEKAFEPFFTTKDIGQGSGLGLSMTYGFMRQSGGWVTIESTVGTGTAVILYLPRFGKGLASHQGEDGFETIPRGSGEIVLVVEDDADVRTLASAQLISLGYKVVEARNGAEALDRLIEAEKIDVVLCDMVMPGGISGTDLLRRMAGRTSESGMSVPFIFMSGYPEGLTQDAPDAERAPPLLTKPFRMIELARTIRAVLDGSPE